MNFKTKLKLINRLAPVEMLEVLKQYDIFINREEIELISQLPNFPLCMDLIVQDMPRTALKFFKSHLTGEHKMNLRRRGYDDEGRLYPGS